MLTKQVALVIHVTIFFYASLSRAVFSEEAYLNDWHLESIGRGIKHVLQSRDNETMVFLSKDNILSYLDAKNGNILHREEVILPEIDYKTADGSLVVYNKLTSTVGKVIDLDSGLEHIQSGSYEDISAFSDIKSPSKDQVSIVFDDVAAKFVLTVRDENTGLPVFAQKLDSDHFETSDAESLDFNFFKADLESSRFTFVITDTSAQVIYFLDFVNNKLKNSWNRDNSVASILAFTIVEPKLDLGNLPRDFFRNTEASTFGDVLLNYFNRVSNSLQQVKNYVFVEKKLKWTTFVLDLFTEDKSPATIASRDLQFGFVKYFIAVNADGFMLCIDMNSGAILWKSRPGFDSEVKGIFSDLENELLVVTENGILYKYNISNLEKLPIFVSKTALREDSSAFISKVDNLGAENVLVEYASGESEVLSTIADHKPSDEDVIIKLNKENGKLSAYSAATLAKTWTYSVDPSAEIIAFKTRDFDEKTSNVAITYGKKALFKFLHQNLLAVASYDKETRILTIDILDSKTGSIIKTAELGGEDDVDLQAPFELLFGEHWLVFAYKSLKPVPEQKLGVIELYEERVDHTLLKTSTSEPLLSISTYIFPDKISSLSLTKTRYGVASKNIIVKLANGQITTIPKFILNSRRKAEKEMDDEDKMEPFMQPYYQVLPINDHFVVTHERNLLSLDDEQLFSVATNMESTTYICDLNRVDLFCSKFAPSGEFDILQSNFQRNQVIFTVTVLIVAFYVVHPMIKRRMLKLKYYID